MPLLASALRKWRPWPSLEAAFVFLLLILGIGVTVLSLRYGFGTVRRPGPGFYPAVIGVLMAFFAALVPLRHY